LLQLRNVASQDTPHSPSLPNRFDCRPLGPPPTGNPPIGAVHRIANPYDESVHIIEFQCGDYLGEDDIVRLEDNYGREGTTT